MWAIGINQSSAILFAEPVAVGGYGMSLNSTGFLYFAPIIAVLIGEALGHFINDVSRISFLCKSLVALPRLLPNTLQWHTDNNLSSGLRPAMSESTKGSSSRKLVCRQSISRSFSQFLVSFSSDKH